MPLQLVMESLDNDSRLFDKILAKCDSFFELSQSEYEVNLKENELQFLEESEGSGKKEADDKAKEGLIARGKATIKKIIEALKEAIHKLTESVKSFFSSKKTKDSIDAIEKGILGNSEIKKKKVEIPDINLIEKVSKKYENEINKVMAQIKGGKTSGLKEKIASIRENHKKEFNAAVAATTVVSAAAAIALIKKHWNPSDDDFDVWDPIDIEGKIGNIGNDDDIIFVKDCLGTAAFIKKSKAHSFCKYPMNILNALKGLFTGTKPMKPVNFTEVNMKKESAGESMSEIDEVKMESIFSDVLNDVENMYKEKSVDEYLENMEKELFSESEDPEISDDIPDESSTEGPVVAEESGKDLDAFLEELEKSVITESSDETENVDGRLDSILEDIENSIM